MNGFIKTALGEVWTWTQSASVLWLLCSSAEELVTNLKFPPFVPNAPIRPVLIISKSSNIKSKRQAVLSWGKQWQPFISSFPQTAFSGMSHVLPWGEKRENGNDTAEKESNKKNEWKRQRKANKGERKPKARKRLNLKRQCSESSTWNPRVCVRACVSANLINQRLQGTQICIILSHFLPTLHKPWKKMGAIQ